MSDTAAKRCCFGNSLIQITLILLFQDQNTLSRFIDNNMELVEIFNSHYINIVENMTGIPPDISPLHDLQENDVYCVKQIIKKFGNHPSIVEITKNISIVEKFTIKETTVSDIYTLLKSVNTKRATGPDNTPPPINWSNYQQM